MATTFTNAGASNVAPATLKLSPDKYVALGTLVDDWSKPDNRDLLVSTYGDQGITGFLQLTGAVTNAGTQDEVQYWEEGRLHKKVAIASGGIVAGATGEIVVADYSDDDGETQAARNNCRLNDVLLSPGGQRLVVTELDDTNEKVKFKRLDGNAVSVEGSATELAIIGNIYAQGTAQPTEFYQTEIIKRTNPFIITKETYAVNGSQATNIGWVNLGNGDYRWYVKGEQDTRKRFMNQREMMLLYGMTGTAGNSITLADGKVTGSEGYFQAVERRGLVSAVSGGAQGTFADMSDIDSIILELDKEGAPAEYAMYLNRAASLDIDDMLAAGIATQVTAGLPGQFGAFNNDSDMAVKLGFKSFTRGGYTFHKHDWKLLNDPQLGAVGDIKGAMVPLANVTDPRTGNSAPSLEMNYKGTNGYNRDVEHWVRGSILGHTNMSEDKAEFYYRSECNLITRAANQHVLIK
jgi:hypothetical protein|tara:strand:- start:384 stop:1772 length:1389 start_codon:yes stop_codon:yes gene_type:complete